MCTVVGGLRRERTERNKSGSTGAFVRRVTTSPCNGSPCILQKGAPASVRINFEAGRQSHPLDAAVHGRMASERITVLWSHNDVCDHVDQSCPLLPGRVYTYTFEGLVPSRYPAGVMRVRWELLDSEVTPFLCVEFNVQLVDPP
ncbi:NPC intracellular cholesterol transporter 2 a, variant 2 [Clonorchis sinensis]|uniref:NPC intracellular cholesterol transporter 2 a, variant 2 n=1 Tax=Clonorchis sinensis TaxID=79923 RepID=A0A8T1LXK6_CLOSI|nr:NPC intracellular cholesterol transporter 2 a, variant 2 [Clonorchis sinensis]